MTNQKKHYYLFIIFFIFSSAFVRIQAQDKLTQDLNIAVGQAINDSKIFLKGYIDPLMNIAGTGLTGGWYTTAKTHKRLGFDFSVTTNFLTVPNTARFFTPQFSNNITFLPSSPTESSATIFGPSESEKLPTYQYSTLIDGRSVTTKFNGTAGLADDIDIKIAKIDLGKLIPVPNYQLGIGIWKKTDIIVRFLPKIELTDDNVHINSYGFGIKHNLKQHLKFIKLLPFDLSGLVGYNTLKFSFANNGSLPNTDIIDINQYLKTSNVSGDIEFTSWTFQGIVSKKIAFLTVYGAIGYNKIASAIKLNGKYEVSYNLGDFNLSTPFENPINWKYENDSFMAKAGMRLKLLVLTLNTEYTMQEYDMFSFGIGISFR